MKQDIAAIINAVIKLNKYLDIVKYEKLLEPA